MQKVGIQRGDSGGYKATRHKLHAKYPVIREASHISHSNQASPMFINFWRKYKIYISIYKMV